MSTADRVLKALEPYGLKSNGQNQYRCISPLRTESDSPSFSLTITGPEHGAFTDHAGEESGSLYTLAKRLGIPLPTRTPVESTKRAYDGLADYATAHGVTAQYLMDHFWRETMHYGRLALEFPTDTGLRYRFIDGNTKRSAYTSAKGYKRCWYGFTEELMIRLAVDKHLVICNGEISAIAGQFHGLASVCVTSGEKAEIPSQLIDELKGKVHEIVGLKIFVAMDCDLVGNKAGIGIGKQLRNAGFDVKVVDLPLGDGGDLADFCMLHTSDSLTALLALPSLAEDENEENAYDWRFVTVPEILDQPPLEWLIPRMLPATGVSTLYGPSGSHKTFIGLDLVLRTAQTKSALCVVGEGEYGIKPRIEGWMKHHQSGPGKVAFVMGSVNMFQKSEFEAFKQQAATYEPALIVIDTFAMCMGEANENDSKDMMVLMRAAKRLAKELNCAVLFIHHTNREERSERGSGRLRDSCDTMIRVEKLDDDLIRVSSEKSKDSAAFPDYYLRPVVVDLGYTDSLGEQVTTLVCLPTDEVVEQSELTNHQRKVLEAISIEPTASIREIAHILNIKSPGQIGNTIGTLVKKGCLTASGRNRSLTEKGKQELQIETDSSDSTNQVTSRSEGIPPHGLTRVERVDGVSESVTSAQTLFPLTTRVKHQYSEGL